ncbi:cation transporter, partial [Escherichia coli]|uniref:cation transporter n=1 Tax=Escherichia coli TaxID=562 RepID=UPI00203421EC
FLLAEVAAGIVFNSLALLSDAAHMFTDAAALAIALAAVRVASSFLADSILLLVIFGLRPPLRPDSRATANPARVRSTVSSRS